MREQDPQFDTLPESLADALREADGPRVLVPESIDRTVLDQAKAHFAERAETVPIPIEAAKSRGWRLGWPMWGGAVAAAVVVGLLTFVAIDAFRDRTNRMFDDLSDAARQPIALQPGSPLELAWDVDHSGSLDVLDVFILAKRQERGDRGVTPEILADLSQRIVSLERMASGLPDVLLAVANHSREWVSFTQDERAG